MLLALSTLALAASVVYADIPRPEHPRPDLRRFEWTNLNGTWEFAETDNDQDETFVLPEAAYPDKIKVPFCRESKLSGLGRTGFVKNVWYRRTFERPTTWKTKRTMLHIGACDWRTTVWINGHKAGSNEGGQIPINLDVTRWLNGKTNTVVIHAFDDTRSGLQALGKQCTELNSFGCLYTRTTGIWQTVWLEGVGNTFVEGMQIFSPMSGKLTIKPSTANDDPRFEPIDWTIQVYDGKRLVASKKQESDLPRPTLNLNVKNPKLWQPNKPHLYRLVLTLEREGHHLDTVESYVGFRSIERKGRAVLINGKPVFQRLVLDQGFYPDGVWTAPSDAALKKDIELSMAVGFNGARLHQKVFEPRYLYWADKLGYIVWGEYPNWGLNYTNDIAGNVVQIEWNDILWRDRNHPSIVGWCPFNETPKEAAKWQDALVEMSNGMDPTRPVIDTSGYIHSAKKPQVTDAHDYDQNPVSFKARYEQLFKGTGLPSRYGTSSAAPNVPFMVSEYGGIGWDAAGGWGYGEGPKTIVEYYKRFKGLTDALLDNPNMFGFCYTQLTDVEQERNGVYRYDRTPKFDASKLRAILSRKAAIEKGVPSTIAANPANWRVILPSARDSENNAWHSTTTRPGEGWFNKDFSDASWYVSPGGFGSKGGSESDTRTPWTTSDIWLRRQFKWDGKPFAVAGFAIHYDNAVEIYVNGGIAWKSAAGAWNDRYEFMDATSALKKLLRKGQNLIAVHCHQDTGGQFIDLALLVK